VFPYALGVTTVIQGLYSLIAIAILMDLGSPTLDLRVLPEWSPGQAFLFAAVLSTITLAVGAVMHTVSRNAFRKRKDVWATEILLSPGVKQRLDAIGAAQPSGAPSLDEVHAAEGFDRVRKAGEFMHALDYLLLIRAPSVHRSIQVYRDQYRLARGFILPSIVLAVVLPFWDPVPLGHVGSFPLISFQLFFLAVFFAGVSMYAFRERSYRYAAARIRGYLTLAAESRQGARTTAAHLTAVD
jgi:hypothetical protein